MTPDPQGMVWEWKEGVLPQESWGALTRKRGTEAGQETCSIRGGEEREGREGWLLRPVQPTGWETRAGRPLKGRAQAATWTKTWSKRDLSAQKPEN